MANITLNGVSNAKDMICFTDCPSILTIDNKGATGNKASATIDVNNLSTLDDTKEYYIEINGARITSTFDINKAVNRTFYLTKSNTINDRLLVAQKIVQAMSNVPEFISIYAISQRQSSGSMVPSIIIGAPVWGAKYNLTITHNLGSTLNPVITPGRNSDPLASGKNNQIYVDIYSADKRIGTEESSWIGYQITTLSKEYIENSVSFDLSPVLATLPDRHEVWQWKAVLFAVNDQVMTNIGSIGSNYISKGYLVNQGGTFIPQFSGIKVAMNVQRGTPKSTYNKTLLYVAENIIPITLITTYRTSSVPIKVNYLNSSLTTLRTDNVTVTTDKNLVTEYICLDEPTFNNSTYIDLVLTDIGTIRYNVIKPLNYKSSNTRIYWDNSYGGISFFDFTGESTSVRKVTNDTYRKQYFDYYSTTTKEGKVIYNKQIENTYTVKTHLIKLDGTYYLNDLLNSKRAWTTINGVEYCIIITNVQIDETNIDGVYEGTVTYQLSLTDSFD